MLRRWLPKDRILVRALYGLLGFILCLGVAGSLRAWHAHQNGWSEHDQKALVRAVSQSGPTSQEAANAVKQLAEKGRPTEVVALLDPATGKAIAAWPAELTGKKPEEMALPSGIKLPAAELIQYRKRFRLEQAGDAEEKTLSVRVTPLYPWSGAGDGEEGKQFGHGGGDGHFRGRERGHGDWSEFDGRQGTVPQPQALLLVAAMEPAVSPLLIVAGVFGGLAVVGYAVFLLSLAWWVFADARKRGGRAFAWGLLVLVTPLVGAAVYLIARQQQQHCDQCGAGVERSFNHCPHCGHGLKQVCSKCGQTLRRGWTYCANCGSQPESPQGGTQA